MADGDISLNLTLDDKDFTVTVKNSGRLLSELKQSLTSTAEGVKKVESHFGSFTTQLRHTVMSLAAIRFAAMDFNDVFLELPKSILKTTGEIERLTKVMEGLSDAQDKVADAQKNQKFIFGLAQQAPFEVTAIKDAFIKLKTGGIDPTNGSLQGLLDSVSKFGGSSEVLKRAAIAIQQMGGKGVISMEELRQQLGEAVPNAMNLMAIATGKTVQQFTKEVGKGTVESKSALERMFLAMQLFNKNASAEMMDTWGGLIEQLKTKWQMLQYTIAGGESGGGAFKAAKDELNKLIQAFDGPQIRTFAADLSEGMYKGVTAVAALVEGVIKYYQEIKTAGELMLYYFAGSKIALMAEGVKNVLAGLGGAYKKASEQYVASQREEAEQNRISSLVKAENAAAEIARKDALIAAEIEKAAAIQRAEQQAREAHGMSMMSAAQMERRWGAVGAAHIAAARADAAAAKELEIALRAEGLAHMNNVRALEAEIVALNADRNAHMAAAAATVELSVAKRMAAGAAGLFSGAINLLGGPIGAITTVLMAGIWAWQEWGNSAEKAAERARAASNKLSTAQHLIDNGNEIEKLQKKLDDNAKLAPVARLDENGATVTAWKEQLKRLQDERKNIQANLLEQGVNDSVASAKRSSDREIKELTEVERQKLDKLNTEMLRIGEKYSDPSSPSYIKSLDAREKAIQKEVAGFVESAKSAGLEQQAKIIGYYREKITGLDAQLAKISDKASPEFAKLKATRDSFEKSLGEAINFKGGLENKFGTSYINVKGKDGLNKSPLDGMLASEESKLAALREHFKNIREGIDGIEGIKKEVDAKIDALFARGKLKHMRDGKVVDDAGRTADVEKLKNEMAEEIALGKAKTLYAQIEKRASETAEARDSALGSLSDGIKEGEATKGIEKWIASLETAANSPAFEALKKQLGGTQKSVEEYFKSMRVAAAETDMANFVRPMAEKTREINAQLANDDRSRKEAAYQESIKRINDEYEHHRQKLIEKMGNEAAADEALKDEKGKLYDYLKALADKHARDMETPMQKLVRDWEDTTKQMQQASTQWANQTVDTLVQFTQTGKLEWRKLFDTIQASMSRIAIQKLIGEPLQGAFDGLIGVLSGKSNTNTGDKTGASGNALSGMFDKLVSGGKKLWASITGATGTVDDLAKSGEDAVSQTADLLGLGATKLTAEEAATQSLLQLAQAAQAAAMSMGGGGGAAGGLGGIGGMIGGIGGIWNQLSSLAGGASILSGYDGIYSGFNGAISWDAAGSTASLAGDATSAMSGFGDTAQSFSNIGSFASEGSGWMEMMSTFATGGIMTEFGPLPLQKYARGGIANSPQAAIFGEGSMPEAYVPLPDGRSIPVTMQGGMGGGGGDMVNIVINVTNNSDGSTQESKGGSGDKDPYRQMAEKIKVVVRQEMVEQQRPGGVLYRG